MSFPEKSMPARSAELYALSSGSSVPTTAAEAAETESFQAAADSLFVTSPIAVLPKSTKNEDSLGLGAS